MTTIDFFRRAENVGTYAAGHPIFEEGDVGEYMCAIQDGEVEIRLGDKVIDRHGPGVIFGEMALLEKKPRSASAVAATDCRLVPIDKSYFMRLVQQTPFFALQVMEILSDRLRRQTEAASG